jgi:hypothetical protein
MDKSSSKVLSKVRPKSGPKRVKNHLRNPKSTVKQANCKTREGQKRGQKWTSKTAPKIEGRDPPRIHLKLTTNRPEIDFKVKIGPVY